MHGGLSTGPKSPSGILRSRGNLIQFSATTAAAFVFLTFGTPIAHSASWQAYVCKGKDFFSCRDGGDGKKRIMLPDKYDDKDVCYDEAGRLLEEPEMVRRYPPDGGPERAYIYGCIKVRQ